jgi:hypothetical protein
VHLNPVRAKLLAPVAPLESFLWSSYGQYFKVPRQHPAWLRAERLRGEKRNLHKEVVKGWFLIM